jgi:glycosyltransferase involved in cell wall biosynthesis
MWFTPEQLKDFSSAEKHTNFYIVTSPFTKDYVIGKLGIPEEKIVLLPYGINAKEIIATQNKDFRKELRGKYKIGSDDYVYINLSAINHQKNILGLARAFNIVQQNIPHAKLVIAGPIYEKGIFDEFEIYVNNNQLEKKISYIGPITNGISLLSMADALVSSSFFEGGPLVIQEAIAANLPVVATRTGISELFDDTNGFYIIQPPIDLYSFEGKLNQLESNSSFEKQLSYGMELCYKTMKRPDISHDIVTLMDKEYVFPQYVKLLMKFINGGQVDKSLYTETWMNRFKPLGNN